MRLILCILLVAALGLYGAACDKPSEDDCKAAVARIRMLHGNENDDPSIERAAIRSCRGSASKDSVKCIINAKDVEAEQLMWAMRQHVDRAQLGGKRLVVRFEFSGLPASRVSRHTWWLVIGPDDVDVCFKNPGYAVDVVAVADLQTYARIWLGYLGLDDAGAKVRFEGAAAFLPRTLSLPQLREAAMSCRGCDLCEIATQVVFGEGPQGAPVVFVGEQPGDQEDLAGRPFVGPAGKLFDAMLEEAGIERSRTYVTNAVKHFKFQMRGKRRLHSKPDGGEIKACRWWIQQELELIRPPVTVALGATAARSLFGKVVTISKLRGEPQLLADGSECWVTVHPSSLLRAPDEQARREGRKMFVADLKKIRKRAEALA